MTTKQVNNRYEVELIAKYDALALREDRDRAYFMTKALESYHLIQDKPEKKEVTAVKPKKEAFDPKSILAEGLNCHSWSEWCDYRKDKRKPVSQAAAKKQLGLLCEYDADTQKEIIDASIANDYTGLFPPKVKTGRGNQNDILNDTSWADGLGDILGQSNTNGYSGQLPRLEEFGGGQGKNIPGQLPQAVDRGDDRKQDMFGFDD
jgi:hypothetical protein